MIKIYNLVFLMKNLIQLIIKLLNKREIDNKVDEIIMIGSFL